jgi:Uncharacterized alpha/beta hydrolase domain (DUF2235)
MALSDTPTFNVELLGPQSASTEIDKALHIFEHNTPPRLRTDLRQIRSKILSPSTEKGTFHFAALYRREELIGFAMFGYYPRFKLVVIDHMVIEQRQRGDAAFFAFTALLFETMATLAVDYVAIEVEFEPRGDKDTQDQDKATGVRLVRLLTRVGFGRVSTSYNLPAMDARDIDDRYDGALMLRRMYEPSDFDKIRRSELEDIVSSIFFDHYLPWYQDFLSASEITAYQKYLEVLFDEFRQRISKQLFVAIDETPIREKRDEPTSGFRQRPRFKHIFIGIDGTWQAAFRDVFQSNVHRMNIALNYEDDDLNPQIFIYSAGVGATNLSSRIFAGATGEGLSSLILNAYINLASNYVPGDKVYIFGFSRGAVAARALTGFVSFCGLLKANSLSLIYHAWRYFTGVETEIDFAPHRGETYDVDVEFLGVWDTVPGPYRFEQLRRRYRFENFHLDRNVKCGVHILSIDESRKSFLPLLWDRCEPHQILEQIWLPGVHSDIGGGYAAAFLSTMSLLFMIERLAQQCPTLSFDTDYIEEILLRIIDREDVVVNDEWKSYYVGKRFKFLTRMQRAIYDQPGQGHAIHPIVDHIRGREIEIRSQKAKYIPSFTVMNSPHGLPSASAPFQSDFGKKLSIILERRFPKSVT